MRFAVISDLHLEDSSISVQELGLDDSLDLVIVAGDLHPNDFKRSLFLGDINKHYGCEVMFVPGNHDYWGKTPALTPMVSMTVKGIKIAGATLWTRLNPHQWVQYMLGLKDYRYIINWEEMHYTAAHETQRQFLLSSGADIIVSHHGPSYQSIHPTYRGDPLSCAYVNELDMEIAEMNCRFWIHGHVHNQFDYMIDKTRVICHPRGYRHEPTNLFYQARIFEI